MKRSRLDINADRRSFEFTLSSHTSEGDKHRHEPEPKKAKQSNNIALHADIIDNEKEEGGANAMTVLGPFHVLPTEVLFYLLSFLTPKDLGTIAQLNWTFLHASSDDFLWRPLCLRSEAVQVKYEFLRIVLCELEALNRSTTFLRRWHQQHEGGRHYKKIGRDGDGESWKFMYKFVTRPSICGRCKRSYTELENTSNGCARHQGYWIDSINSEEARWSCCESKSKEDPGCSVQWHVNNCSWLAL